VYGAPQYLPVDEHHPTQPVDINGVNKLAGEWYHLLYHRIYDIPTCVLRLTNTYGPCMRIKDARQTFLGIWIKRLLQDQPFELWGGAQQRDFTYVDDVVDALLRAAADPIADGKVYNLGGDQVVSLERLAQLLIQIHGRGRFEVRDFPEARRRIDIGDYYTDDALIRGDLGWAPEVALETGLERTLDYYRQHGSHYMD
jgi:nucleoside-diphosphate-sugar epimerase